MECSDLGEPVITDLFILNLLDKGLEPYLLVDDPNLVLVDAFKQIGGKTWDPDRDSRPRR